MLSATTPNATDPFSRFMAEVFDDRKLIAVSTGFQAFFGRPETGAETVISPDSNAVDIDIIRGNEKISALIPRGTVSRPLGSNQKNIQEGRFSTFSRKYPLAEEEGDINADQLIYRLAGENPYQQRTRLDRMRQLALNIHTESIRRIIRMDEVLAAQSILSGKQDAIIGTTDTDLQYDFRRLAAHIVTVGTAWNGVSPDVLGDIDAACDKLRANGKVLPDFMGFGSDAMSDFLKDSNIKSLADNRRIDFVQAGVGLQVPPKFQRFIDAGWIMQGRLRTFKGYELYLFTYLDVYTNSGGTATKYMPSDQAFITSTNARFDRYFGPAEQLPMIPQRMQLYMELFGFNPEVPPMPANMRAPGTIIDPSTFYVDAYVAADWKKVTVRTQHAPIFATTQTDAIVTLKGLHT